MTKQKSNLDDLDYNWLLQDSDTDKSEYDCCDLDDFAVDCVWQPHKSLHKVFSSDKEETEKESLLDVLHNFSMKEDKEDSNDKNTADNRNWTDYIRRQKLFPFSGQGGL